MYRFTVKNIGQGYAKDVLVYGEAPTRKKVDNSLVSKYSITIKKDALNPGQALTGDIPCHKTSLIYCDYVLVYVYVNGIVQDANGANNAESIDDNVY